MERLVNSTKFSHRQGQLRRPIPYLKRAHDPGGWHPAQFERAGQAQEVVPVRLYSTEGDPLFCDRVEFTAMPRIEDRRMRLLAVKPKAVTRHTGVVLRVGPQVLMANADKPRPVLVAKVGPDGVLRMPLENRFPRVDTVSNQRHRRPRGQRFPVRAAIVALGSPEPRRARRVRL